MVILISAQLSYYRVAALDIVIVAFFQPSRYPTSILTDKGRYDFTVFL
jgi:hypothetical protein